VQIQKTDNVSRKEVKIKVASTVSALLGTALSLSMIRKSKNTSKVLLDSYNGKDILGMATGSICGGLLGGTLVDPTNSKAKIREGLTQIIGNTAIPLILVTTSLGAYKKLTGKDKNMMMVVVGTIALGTGIYLGNKVSNLINEKIFHREEHRKIRLTDFAPHVDDTCVGLTVIFNNSNIGNKISKIIPFALTIGGYSTGIAKEKN